MMGWYGHDWGWGAWFGMGAMMLLFWGGLAAVVVVLVRGTRGQEQHPAGSAAQEALDLAFARGEITEEEYRRRRDVLRGLG